MAWAEGEESGQAAKVAGSSDKPRLFLRLTLCLQVVLSSMKGGKPYTLGLQEAHF